MEPIGRARLDRLSGPIPGGRPLLATDTTSPPGPGGEGQRRPLTLDLSAEEISRADSEGTPDPADLDAEDERAFSGYPSESEDLTPDTGAEPWSPPATESGGTDDWRDAQVEETPLDTTDPGAYAAPPAQTAPTRARRGASFPALLLAALLGGVVSAGGLLALERAGFLEFLQTPDQPDPEIAGLQREVAELGALRSEVANLSTLPIELAALREARGAAPAGGPDLGPLEGQVAELEQGIAELRNRPASAVAWPDAAAIAELRSRLAELERRPAGAASGQPTEALEGRLTELAGQVAGLRNSGAGGVAAPALAEVGSRIDDVSGRLGALEERPPVDVAGLQADIAELERQAADLSARQAALPEIERRVTEIAAAQNTLPEIGRRLAELATRMEAVPAEERIAAVETNLNTISRQAETGRALGPAVVANALTSALDAGEPFRAELDALRGLGLDEAALAGLAPHAEGGLPTLAELQSSFDAALGEIDLSTPIPAGARTVDRFLQSARSLVEVRPANPTEGGDPGAVVARMGAAVEAGDLRLALAEWDALPEAAKTRLAEWASGAQARGAAEELAARLRSDALARLKPQG